LPYVVRLTLVKYVQISRNKARSKCRLQNREMRLLKKLTSRAKYVWMSRNICGLVNR